MVVILDGNSEIGTHIRSNIWYLICLRLLITSRSVINRIFFLRKSLFFFMRAQHIMSYHLIQIPWSKGQKISTNTNNMNLGLPSWDQIKKSTMSCIKIQIFSALSVGNSTSFALRAKNSFLLKFLPPPSIWRKFYVRA